MRIAPTLVFPHCVPAPKSRIGLVEAIARSCLIEWGTNAGLVDIERPIVADRPIFHGHSTPLPWVRPKCFILSEFVL